MTEQSGMERPELQELPVISDRMTFIYIGYVEVGGGRIVSQQSILISVDKIPEEIIKLTGITPELATRDGSDLKSAIERVLEMIDDRNVLIYNAEFNLAFLKKGAKSCGIDFPDIHLLDVFELSKKMIKDAPNYKSVLT